MIINIFKGEKYKLIYTSFLIKNLFFVYVLYFPICSDGVHKEGILIYIRSRKM